MRVNKYNTLWQIARVYARTLKDPRDKIGHVVAFLNSHKSAENLERVLNWLDMTRLGYKGRPEEDLFVGVMLSLKMRESRCTALDDDVELESLADGVLTALYKDLVKRKYGFRYKHPP